MSDSEFRLLETLAAADGVMLARDVPSEDRHTIDLLIARGYVQSERRYPVGSLENPMDIYAITKAGRVALADHRSKLADRRWTRALAIAALIISLLSLALEFEDRGYLDWFRTTRSAPQSAVPTPSGKLLSTESKSPSETPTVPAVLRSLPE